MRKVYLKIPVELILHLRDGESVEDAIEELVVESVVNRDKVEDAQFDINEMEITDSK